MTTVLVTGASSGIGRALSEGLHLHGYKVVATMRQPGSRNSTASSELSEAGMHVVELDVLSEESVETAIERAIELVGPLDVVINNAGYAIHGPVESATAADIRAQFDTNVLGPHRVARAVLPAMRESGRGLLLQISSGQGRFVQPGSGLYAASKWALEALSESLRIEVSNFGIDVVIVELGPYRTKLMTRNAVTTSDRIRIDAYSTLEELRAQDRQRRFEEDSGTAVPPSTLVGPVIGLIEAERGTRPTRYVPAEHPLVDELRLYNETLEGITSRLLRSRGYDLLLSLRSGRPGDDDGRRK